MEDLRHLARAIGKDHDACGLGIVAKLKADPDHEVVRRAVRGLTKLSHRGAIDADGISGDGAGILIEIPHEFFQQFFPLPNRGQYAVGTLFTPQQPYVRNVVLEAVEAAAIKFGYKLWLRQVPVGSHVLGPTARSTEPTIYQVMFLCNGSGKLGDRALHELRLRLQRVLLDVSPEAFLSGISTSTLTYKAMVQPRHLAAYFPDLVDEKLKSRFAQVHTRFSTNTLPRWSLIQPFDRISHNGEFNTLKGNLTWLMAEVAKAKRTQDYNFDFADVCPEGSSDSCLFDRSLDWRVAKGELVVDALRRMLPPAWEHSGRYNRLARRYLEHLNLTAVPWGGPSLVGFTDGARVGAVLDRSGLRPARYGISHDGWFYLGSEAGAFLPHPEQIAKEGRLRPGEMLVVEPKSGAILEDKELLQLQMQRFWNDHTPQSLKREASLPPVDEPPLTDDTWQRLWQTHRLTQHWMRRHLLSVVSSRLP